MCCKGDRVNDTGAVNSADLGGSSKYSRTRSLSTDEEKGSMETVFDHGLVGPKLSAKAFHYPGCNVHVYTLFTQSARKHTHSERESG